MAATRIRPAEPRDVATILRFIHELAEYERRSHELATSATALHQHLFGTPAICGALLAEADGVPVGFALFFTSYSTFNTAPCLHLEDLYVLPAARGQGHGKALLGAVAELAVRRGCARLEWTVLDWNEPAIRFYRSLGAALLADWRICRVQGAEIAQLAQRARG
ncbi:MAG: GNAT family N-acetyltransferase [Planctomycetes bacterium]|nr:GNAT family N-acetyltransferase [Planctomycetota bacterium]